MATLRMGRLLGVAAAICVLVGAGPGGRARGQQPETPTFRTDANYVLTDVFVTADGKPVTDLTQADFEVKEDGVLQTIRSFEAVRHTADAGALPRRNPSTLTEMRAMAADPRRRVFVVFLDTYHVARAESMIVRQALMTFLKSAAFGSDDLIAFMVPQMSGGDITFSTTTDPLVAYLDGNPQWGVEDEKPGTESDPLERELQTCYCCGGQRDAEWAALRSRLREQKSIDALRGLVANLDGLRESRKAVIAVSAGWRLFRDNDQRMSDSTTKDRMVPVQPIGVGPDGRLAPQSPNRTGGASTQACDIGRLQASYSDSRTAFQDLIGEANRASTSFYTLDPGGLRTQGRPITPPSTAEIRGAAPPGTAVRAEMRNRDRMPYSLPSDSLRSLGEATNGMALVDTNDLGGALGRAAADFNSYYLLGYTSTNGKPDGKYRKINVTVKRPGVRVRSREGYLARRLDEAPASGATPTGATSPGASTATANPTDAQLTAALARLTPPRPDVPLVVSAAAGAVPGGTARSIRVTAELDSTVAATPEWADGGEAQAIVRNAKGDTVTMGKALLPKGARTVEFEVPVVEGMAGDVKVQVRLSGTGSMARYMDTTTVSLDAMPAGWGAPRLSRRGPSTGVAWVPTADPRFRRQERLRVSVGVGAEAGAVTASLLDRQGRPINVPVKVDQTAPEALVAELTLAPLATGDYVLALGGGPKRLLVPLRIVP